MVFKMRFTDWFRFLVDIYFKGKIDLYSGISRVNRLPCDDNLIYATDVNP